MRVPLWHDFHKLNIFSKGSVPSRVKIHGNRMTFRKDLKNIIENCSEFRFSETYSDENILGFEIWVYSNQVK